MDEEVDAKLSEKSWLWVDLDLGYSGSKIQVYPELPSIIKICNATVV